MQQQSLPPPSLTQKAPFQFPPPVQSNPPRMFGGWCVARQVALALLHGAVLSGSSVPDAQGQGMIFEPSIDTTSFVEVVLRLGSARCASARLSLSLLSLSLYLSRGPCVDPESDVCMQKPRDVKLVCSIFVLMCVLFVFVRASKDCWNPRHAPHMRYP